jgi:CRP/FNR family transcriptional regulator
MTSAAPSSRPDWLASYPALAGLEEAALPYVRDLAPVSVPAGTILFSPGSACPGFVILIEGSIRVAITGPQGRSIVLYRVGHGETCVQTTLCALGDAHYTAEGVTEAACRAVIMPLPRFEALMGVSPLFRRFVFSRFGERLDEITRLLEAVAFVSIEARLCGALMARRPLAGDVIRITHQTLADEIGSAREVVSRTLDALARQGLLELTRGAITVRDPGALAKRAGAMD